MGCNCGHQIEPRLYLAGVRRRHEVPFKIGVLRPIRAGARACHGVRQFQSIFARYAHGRTHHGVREFCDTYRAGAQALSQVVKGFKMQPFQGD